jgi:hypothetical protein
MIIYQNTRFTKTTDGDFVPGAPIDEEGLALIYRSVNGVNLLDVCQGASDEVFAGFSISRAVPSSRLPAVETGVVSAAGVMQLSRSPESSSIYVSINGAAAADISVGSSASADAGEVVLDGDQLLFAAADFGKAIYVQYHFEPTFQEARDATGDAPIGGDAALQMDRVGLIIEGNPISLTTFDSSVSWAGIMHPSLGANGLLTAGGSGTVLKDFIVIAGPAAGSPYLTLQSRN